MQTILVYIFKKINYALNIHTNIINISQNSIYFNKFYLGYIFCMLTLGKEYCNITNLNCMIIFLFPNSFL
jgi:hypothetical protein